jgi:chromosome segregation protein
LYLSKLEIFGFKSFSQKTVINFTKGVTAIVGPNGCGKTNIVDAIRWVLGEQRTTTLRSDKMENVIFNGTQNKKPMGMAEVSMTLINDLGILPTEYSEVTITRRIFRSGESEYLLNHNICRLKDITNLFMDTGMGTNAYSVIELKMVETILSNKADERRTMFEEAAGVNKYKLRRRLSLKKLEDIRRDLTRVNDIVSEVEKQVNSLERQAKKAEKYNKVTTILRELELDLSEREYSLWHNKKSLFKEDKEKFFQEKIKIESELRSLEDELTIFRGNISTVEASLSEKRKEIAEHNEVIHNVKNSLSVSAERNNSLGTNLERYKQELEEFHTQLKENDEFILNTHKKIEDLIIKISGKAKHIEDEEENLNVKKIQLDERKFHLKNQSDLVQEKSVEITLKENQLENTQNSLNESNTSIDKLNNRILSTTNTIAKTVGYLEELDLEKSEAEKKLKEWDALYVQKQNEKAALEKKLSELKGKDIEEKGIIAAVRDKIDFLQSLINNLEGISKGAKILFESKGWTDKEKMMLADVGETEDKYRFAIEASLKNVLNNLLIETFDDLQKAINYLKKNELGKASFYVLGIDSEIKNSLIDRIQNFSSNRKAKRISREKGFLGWANSFISTDDKWKPFFIKLLNRTAVIDELESAFRLKKLHPGFNFATLNGDFIHESGLVEAGSLPRLDDTLFGRKKLLQNLKNEFPKYMERLEKVRLDIEKTEEELEKINLKELTDQDRILLNEVANIEKQIAQLEFEKKKFSDEIEKLRTEIQDLAKKSNQFDNEVNSLNEFIVHKKNDRETAQQILSTLENEVKSAEEEFNSLQNVYTQSKLELERLIGEKKNFENSIERAKQAKEILNKSITKRESDITGTNEELLQLAETMENKQTELTGLEETKQQHLIIESDITSRLTNLKSQASELEKKLSESGKEREKLSDNIHSIDIKLNEINLKIENLVEHIKENYSLTLELKEFEDNNIFNFEERTSEVLNYKQQIKNLGPINLLSYSEFEEEKQRLEFLHKQRDDLVDSEKDLLKTIDEINITAQNLFQETFNIIRDNFIKIFRSLFNPGDEADLRLEENADSLDGKIEIIAKPKGKRPTSIELLSGGEKTLTAIALLFSIYLVKPSPFCILDEVDAPLDDANIDRFTKIIKEFSASTQFIMVTHNKRTMEAAETMYGVTMQDEGISKLVSVQFNEDLNIAAN